ILWPGRRVPFILQERRGCLSNVSRSKWLQGRGNHIGIIRQRIFNNRRDRDANYRNASRRKGHGRKGESEWRDRSSQSWRNFVKRVNHQVSANAVSECLR